MIPVYETRGLVTIAAAILLGGPRREPATIGDENLGEAVDLAESLVREVANRYPDEDPDPLDPSEPR